MKIKITASCVIKTETPIAHLQENYGEEAFQRLMEASEIFGGDEQFKLEVEEVE